MPRKPQPLRSIDDIFNIALNVVRSTIQDTFNEIFRAQGIPGIPKPPKANKGERQKASKRPVTGPRIGKAAKVPGQGKVSPGTRAKREKTLYEELGVFQDEELWVIRGQFVKLSKKYHPDTYSHRSGSKKHEERYKRITHAWSVLKDHGKRAAYDLSLRTNGK